jgi:hypothetical protein
MDLISYKGRKSIKNYRNTVLKKNMRLYHNQTNIPTLQTVGRKVSEPSALSTSSHNHNINCTVTASTTQLHVPSPKVNLNLKYAKESTCLMTWFLY